MSTDRRDFLQGSVLGTLGMISAIGARNAKAALPANPTDSPLTSLYGLTAKLDPISTKKKYLPGAKGINDLPYVYFYYDTMMGVSYLH
jgi:hypothetical protein